MSNSDMNTFDNYFKDLFHSLDPDSCGCPSKDKDKDKGNEKESFESALSTMSDAITQLVTALLREQLKSLFQDLLGDSSKSQDPFGNCGPGGKSHNTGGAPHQPGDNHHKTHHTSEKQAPEWGEKHTDNSSPERKEQVSGNEKTEQEKIDPNTTTDHLGMFPTPSSKPEVINETRVIKAGEVFDGEGKTFTGGPALGDGSQAEGQKPLFILEDGAVLKNVILGDNGADGIHTKGDAELHNVHWTNVGEDALTMKEGGTVKIYDSSAKDADDKIFQLNDSGTLLLDNFAADDFGKLVRTNGGQQGDWNILLKDVTATNGKHALVQSDSDTINVVAENVQAENVKKLYVLRDSAGLEIS